MKLKPLIIVGLLVWTSCANQTQAFYIEKFYPLGPGCDLLLNAKDIIAGNGYLDVAAGAGQFFVGVHLVGSDKIQQPAVSVGTTTMVNIENANRDQPIIKQMVVTYRLSKRVGSAPKPYVTNITIPFISGEVFAPVQLISPDLASALFDGLTPSAGPPPSSVIEDFVDISADVEFKGNFSASNNPFTTGVLTFPIRAYRSLPLTCANGYQRFPIDAASGNPDFCNYTGMMPTQLVAPSPPACCPSVGSPGC